MSAADLLYVITDLQVGGVPLHLMRLARAMHERGLVVEVVSLAVMGPVGAQLADSGIVVFDCGGRGGWDFRVLGRLSRLLRTRAPRMVHSLLFHGNVATRWAARRAGIAPERVICEIQTVEVERRWHLAVDRWTYRWCRCIVGNSPAVIDHLHRVARIPRERLRLIRGGIDPIPYRSATVANREFFGVPAEEPLILWVGRLDPVKGLSLLIEAFAAVAAQLPAHLYLVGDGPQRQVLEAEVRARGLRTRVHFAGVRQDIPALLQSANLFAFPSRTEGLPNALLEAMAAGCPVVATDVPGCRDLVAHERTGLLVPYGDATALARALLRLLTQRNEASELAQEAQACVERDWHIDRMFEEYAALYRECLGRPFEGSRGIGHGAPR